MLSSRAFCRMCFTGIDHTVWKLNVCSPFVPPAVDFALLFADVKQKLDKVTVLMMRLEVARLTVSWLLESLISSGPPPPPLV